MLNRRTTPWARVSCTLLLFSCLAGCLAAPVSPTPEPTPVPATRTRTRPLPTHTPAAPTPLPAGKLVVRSTPAGATIRLNDSALGEPTPWEGELPVGEYEVQLSLSSYEPWKETVEITRGATVTIDAQLEFSKQATVLQSDEWFELRGLRLTVQFVQWDPDGKLRYAVGDNVDEPKDWAWFAHDVRTGVTEELPPPVSQVSDEVRAELGLCSLDEEPMTMTETSPCWVETVLTESPSGKHMVYAPPDHVYRPDGTPYDVCYRLWHADTEGRNRVLLAPQEGCLHGGAEDAARPDVIWSPREDWILVDLPYEAMNVYLAKTDGSVFTRFPPSEGLSTYRGGLMPVFSPDGAKIAFVATPGNYHLRGDPATWVLDVEGGDPEKVSDQIGLLQWSADGRHLYIFDLAWTHTLYRVDLTEEPPRETSLAAGIPSGHSRRPSPYYVSLWESPWALSPDETMVAYYGVDGKGHFGILQFAPGE